MIERLPIVYDIPSKNKLVLPFLNRTDMFEDPYDEFADVCLDNLTFAARTLLRWKGKPVDLAPFQSVILDVLWNKTFPILLASRGASKTWLLALYAVLRAMLTPGSKIVIVASSFRQSKLVFEYVEEFYEYSPILRAACVKPPEKQTDRHRLRIGTSSIMALPLGNGEKIRGIRATTILCDEYASIPPEIFQVVVRGFAAVSADPIEAARRAHEEEKADKEGGSAKKYQPGLQGNQIIYSGTANYQFNHFYKLFCVHKAIIESEFVGSADKLNTSLDIEDDDENKFEGDLDYRDYAIVQIPYQAIPKGFMDEKQIAQARATMPRSLFQMEYECVFPTDSDGFIQRSVINKATPGMPGWNAGAPFGIEKHGSDRFKYVMGIDPARKTDNFAISILKLMGNGVVKNVFCTSFNKKSFNDCTREIRKLLRTFNVVRIAMDAGGGGLAIEDNLQDPAMIPEDEQPIWRIDDDETLKFEGLHILDMVNFTSSWLGEANYGLASDIEQQRLIFPYRTTDTSRDEEEEDIWEEIDEQKDEICMITVTSTKTGVQHFDIPELPASQQSTIKQMRRKDRYSALLLAAYAARSYGVETTRSVYPSTGGWIGSSW